MHREGRTVRTVDGPSPQALGMRVAAAVGPLVVAVVVVVVAAAAVGPEVVAVAGAKGVVTVVGVAAVARAGSMGVEQSSPLQVLFLAAHCSSPFPSSLFALLVGLSALQRRFVLLLCSLFLFLFYILEFGYTALMTR